jgi:RND family efflux transporter MFP subunit
MSVVSARPPRRGWYLLGPGLLLAALAGGCTNGEPAKKAGKPVAVTVVKPIIDDVLDYQDFTGRLSAVQTVELRARVSGYVTKANFKEGDTVSKGAVLFEIDRRPYQVKLDQARAQLGSARATASRARTLYSRAYALLGKKSGFQEEVDMRKGDLDVAEAAVLEAKAKVEDAQLNLDFCSVTAPTSGRVSRRLVDPGNMVVTDTTPLTTLVTEGLLYAYFDVDERTFLDLVGAPAPSPGSRLPPWVAKLQLPVLMRLANEEDFIRRLPTGETVTRLGKVDFIDNQVIGTTGTIRMRGVFKDPERALKPGLFTRIRLPLGAPYKALLIPDEALMTDQGRKVVYALDAQDRVEYCKVKVGQAVGGFRVILPPDRDKDGKTKKDEGLTEQDRVLLTGLQRVQPGARVVPTLAPAPPRPESPLRQLIETFNRSRLAGNGKQQGPEAGQ